MQEQRRKKVDSPISDTADGESFLAPAGGGWNFSSNCVRLTKAQLLLAALLVAIVFVLIGGLWKKLEKFEPTPDYRLPYQLSNDYWLWSRYCRLMCDKNKTIVVGDSVIWGQYVAKQQTLSHYLNELSARQSYANMGMDGTHPMALARLIEHYGTWIRNKKVILHFNPLWMSSARHDLQLDKEFAFNHPRLVPQFIPAIPCYEASLDRRIGIIIERNIPFLGWKNHLQIAYFRDDYGVPRDIPKWTLEHPYGNPLSAVTFNIPELSGMPRHEPLPWTHNGAKKSDFPWVDLDSSLQWGAFKHLVKTLYGRNNKVIVVVGPFNEHMMTEESLKAYRLIKKGILAWLNENKVLHYIPKPLQSDLYADASHPLTEGYYLLAKGLIESGVLDGY